MSRRNVWVVARLNDPGDVRREYATEKGLLARSSIYAGSEGTNANDVLVDAIVDLRPADLLEVGCGPGWLAERLRDEYGLAVRTVDISERMVKLTRARGIDAQVADVQALPFDDESFDCIVAAWMLYHVADLDRGLGEISRVLRPSGHLLAVTNSTRHLEEVWQLVGIDRVASSFNAENGRAILERHFTTVEQRDVEGIVIFPDAEAVRRYVAASPAIAGPDCVDRVPELDGPFRATRRNCLLLASTAPRSTDVRSGDIST